MENDTKNLKDIEIEVEGKKLQIFKRFPDLAPFIGEEYESGKHKKLLLIWESYYTTKSAPEIIRSSEMWYFEPLKINLEEFDFDDILDKNLEELEYHGCDEQIQDLFGHKTLNYERHWNFASKMHEKGIDRKSPTFQNVEKILDKFSKDKNSFKYCAGYNYYLRPALNSSSIKSDDLDEEVARETLKEIIKELNPDAVIFFSKKANTSFKSHKKEFNNIKFKAFVHPACVWWNKKYGKEPKKAGKQRFEEFIERLD